MKDIAIQCSMESNNREAETEVDSDFEPVIESEFTCGEDSSM